VIIGRIDRLVDLDAEAAELIRRLSAPGPASACEDA
jgi:hypothetical protein